MRFRDLIRSTATGQIETPLNRRGRVAELGAAIQRQFDNAKRIEREFGATREQIVALWGEGIDPDEAIGVLRAKAEREL